MFKRIANTVCIVIGTVTFLLGVSVCFVPNTAWWGPLGIVLGVLTVGAGAMTHE